MPNSHVPIFTLAGQCEPSTYDYLIRMINAIARNAFRLPISCSVVNQEQKGLPEFLLDTSSLVEIEDPREIAVRLGETLIRTLGSLGAETGIRFRFRGIPGRPALNISGLTRHQLRLQLLALFAGIESQTQLELTCCWSPLSLRIWAGGVTGTASSYLCEEIVRRRSTRRGDVIRIRVGKRLMSIALPVDYSACHIKHGSLISTAPVVGLVPRRVVQAARCQFSMFD